MPGRSGLATTAIVTLAPAATESIRQTSTNELPQLPAAVFAETSAIGVAGLSVTTTSAAAASPLLVTTRLYFSGLPSTTLPLPTCLAICSRGWPGAGGAGGAGGCGGSGRWTRATSPGVPAGERIDSVKPAPLRVTS